MENVRLQGGFGYISEMNFENYGVYMLTQTMTMACMSITNE